MKYKYYETIKTETGYTQFITPCGDYRPVEWPNVSINIGSGACSICPYFQGINEDEKYVKCDFTRR